MMSLRKKVELLEEREAFKHIIVDGREGEEGLRRLGEWLAALSPEKAEFFLVTSRRFLALNDNDTSPDPLIGFTEEERETLREGARVMDGLDLKI